MVWDKSTLGWSSHLGESREGVSLLSYVYDYWVLWKPFSIMSTLNKIYSPHYVFLMNSSQYLDI